MLDANGLITSPWLMWMTKLIQRAGGNYSLPIGSTSGSWVAVFTGGIGSAIFQANYMTLGNQLFWDIVIDASSSAFGMSNGSVTLPVPALAPGTMSAINLDPAAPYHDFGNGRIVDGFAFPPDFSIDHQKALLSGRYMWQ